MVKTYKISIPKFLTKQKKIKSELPSILIDKNIFYVLDEKGIDANGILLYIYLLTRLDEKAEFEGLEKKIIENAKLPRRTDLEALLKCLNVAGLLQFEIQMEAKWKPNGNQMANKLPKVCKKTSTHIKDTRVEQINKKVSKQININIVRLENEPSNFQEIIDYLNKRANTKYRSDTKKTRKLISARIQEGFTVEDFKQVIDKKCLEWLSDSKMCKFLRPVTLFSEEKFEGYLNQRVSISKTHGVSDLTARNMQVLEEVLGDRREDSQGWISEDGGHLQDGVIQISYNDIPGGFT